MALVRFRVNAEELRGRWRQGTGEVFKHSSFFAMVTVMVLVMVMVCISTKKLLEVVQGGR